MRLKSGDKVKVIYGKERGKESVIEKAFPKQQKVVVSGVNVVKKHVKKRGEQEGGIIEVTRPIPVSRLMLICPKCGKTTRVQYYF